jgi:hypothetical protein
MDADETAARLHVGLQAGLLLGVEDIAAAGQDDDRVVTPQCPLVGEDPRVVGGLGLEPLVHRTGQPDPLDRRDAGVDDR